MTPTIRLDKSYRPLTVPDHFIAYQTDLATDRLSCKITFLRQREGDPTAWDLIRTYNGAGGKYVSTSACASFSHTLVRAPRTVGPTYEVDFVRGDVQDIWTRVDDASWMKLLRQYTDETIDPNARE